MNATEQKMRKVIYIWEKISDEDARLYRVLGTDGIVNIPGQIDGHSVSELGTYCFSRRRLLQADLFSTSLFEDGTEITEKISTDFQFLLDQNSYLHELSEKYIQQVQLPASLRKIGSCAFYNCSKMKELHIASKLDEIGSDAFMNCLDLTSIVLHAHYNERTGLKQLLSQVKWQVEVLFAPEGNEVEAAFLFPEYYESYDEIGPAHIFELNLTGEGFRARQCFKDGRILAASYDEIFPQACVEEKTEVLNSMAWGRLLYEKDLTAKAKMQYEKYLREHAESFVQHLICKKKLDELHDFFQKGYGTEMLMDEAVQLVSSQQWTEAVASLLTWKREIYTTKTNNVKSRYSFDDF